MSTDRPQTIFRAARSADGFTQVTNNFSQDTRISQACRGLVLMLISRPHDWEVKITQIIENYKEGKAAVYAIIKEAILFGYMGKHTVRDERGRIKKTIYWVTDDCNTSPVHPENKLKNSPLPENQEMAKKPLPENREMDGENVVNSSTSRLSVSWKPGNASLYKQINIKAAASSFYENSEIAFEIYKSVQGNFGFRSALGIDDTRRAAISQTLKSLSEPNDKIGHTGLMRWVDLLERASCSDWFCGKCEPAKGFSHRYRLSIDDMTNPKILEKLEEMPIRFGPKDQRWALWTSWAQVHDQKLFRIMSGVSNGTFKTDDWAFAHSLPPAQQKLGGALDA